MFTMKKVFFLLMAFAMVSTASAQSTRSRSGQNGNSRQYASGLTVSSNLNTYFWVYIDDVLQNERSVRSITITDLPQADLYIRVV